MSWASAMTPSEYMLKPENAKLLKEMMKAYNDLETESIKAELEIMREVLEEKDKREIFKGN